MIKDTQVVIMEKREEMRKLMIDFDKELESAMIETVNSPLEATEKYVSSLKKPFLRELIENMSTNSIENKYNASDVLCVLEKVEVFLSNQKMGEVE